MILYFAIEDVLSRRFLSITFMSFLLRLMMRVTMRKDITPETMAISFIEAAARRCFDDGADARRAASTREAYKNWHNVECLYFSPLRLP